MSFYDRDEFTIHHGDSLAILPAVPADSVAFILEGSWVAIGDTPAREGPGLHVSRPLVS
jgi:hypothetical protein